MKMLILTLTLALLAGCAWNLAGYSGKVTPLGHVHFSFETPENSDKASTNR